GLGPLPGCGRVWRDGEEEASEVQLRGYRSDSCATAATGVGSAFGSGGHLRWRIAARPERRPVGGLDPGRQPGNQGQPLVIDGGRSAPHNPDTKMRSGERSWSLTANSRLT